MANVVFTVRAEIINGQPIAKLRIPIEFYPGMTEGQKEYAMDVIQTMFSDVEEMHLEEEVKENG